MGSKARRSKIGIWMRTSKVLFTLIRDCNGVEVEEEPEDNTVHTYENAVTLYEDKKYYPDAEEVASVSLHSFPGFQRSRGVGARRRYARHQRAHH